MLDLRIINILKSEICKSYQRQGENGPEIFASIAQEKDGIHQMESCIPFRRAPDIVI